MRQMYFSHFLSIDWHPRILNLDTCLPMVEQYESWLPKHCDYFALGGGGGLGLLGVWAAGSIVAIEDDENHNDEPSSKRQRGEEEDVEKEGEKMGDEKKKGENKETNKEKRARQSGKLQRRSAKQKQSV